MLTRKPIVVLGAGAAGLCAARELTRLGRDVIVVEKEALPGGLCRTFEHRGWRFDLGGHRFLSDDEALARDVHELLGDDLLEASRRSVILLGGRRYQYPLEAVDLLRNLDPRLAARGFAGYLAQKARNALRPPATGSFADWATSRFGRGFYELFFGPYTEKLWGIPPAQLSGDWASQRISLLDLTDVALRLLGLRRSATRTYARRYFYPRRGIGQIFTAMTDALRRDGGEVVLGAEVVGLGVRGARAREVIVRDATGTRTIACDHVISTLPLPDLARLLGPGEPAVGAAANRLRFRGVRFLNVLLDREDVSENTWMYVADPRYLATRIQEPKRRSPESAPPGKTSLMLEIPCEVGGDVWGAPDADLLDRCLRDLDALGLRVGRDVLGCFSTRITHGYPVFRLGYQVDRDRLLAVASAVENVTTCGRQGTFRYVFMDTAMQMGILAARQACARERGADVRIVSLHDEPRLRETAALTA